MNSGTRKKTNSDTVTSTVSDKGLHSEQVFGWRQSEFKRMGFVDYVADYLAATRIDLHQMEDLLNQGCSHDLAASILKDTFWGGDDPGQFAAALVYDED